MMRWLLPLLFALAFVTPVRAEEPVPPVVAPPYREVTVLLSTGAVLREGDANWIAGSVVWPDGRPAWNGVVTTILHFPPSPHSDDEARSMDVARFVLIDTDGTFGAWFVLPVLLTPDETGIPIEGQFSVLSFEPDPVQSLTLYGWSDTRIPMVVTR